VGRSVEIWNHRRDDLSLMQQFGVRVYAVAPGTDAV
jgi:hypothetical protein